ncbi:MAG: TM2 domain-containing protein [Candidatus Magnetoovum sp. WYHC-5]|nr:TM2 domain-containing protein [Candidatus Magnetoovum sp. WYHC-5]
MERKVLVSPNSRLIALFFCMFFGWAGLHRFYVKKIGTGFLMFFTMGGFGMWYFLDIFLITIGVFKDRDNLPLIKW